MAKKKRETPDPTPMAVPVTWKRPPTLQEQFARLMSNYQKTIVDNGFETPEEADDFDIPDDQFDPSTPWEEKADHEVNFKRYFNPPRQAPPKKSRKQRVKKIDENTVEIEEE